MTYQELLSDWKILYEECGVALDMTGGYVDQNDLDRLLKSPTKATAKECLKRQIDYWFQVGTEECTAHDNVAKLLERYPQAASIAEKYGYS